MKVLNSIKKHRLLAVFYGIIVITDLNFVNVDAMGGTSYTFETFSYPNAWITSPFGMNDLGMHVGMYFPKISIHEHHGYLYDGSIFTNATALGDLGIHATDITNDGILVFSISGSDGAYIDDGITRTYVKVPGSRYTNIYGINDIGIVVGEYAVDHDHDLHGFIYDWDLQSFVEFVDFPGSVRSSFSRINNGDPSLTYGGLITGIFRDSSGHDHGFVYDGIEFTQIDVPGADDTYVRSINDHGIMVGMYAKNNEDYQFKYDGQNFDFIDTPWSAQTFDIDNSNRIIGTCTVNSTSLGFLGTPVTVTTIVDIDIKPGSFPNSINPNTGGVIPVAILTTDDFDASSVDPATVQLNGTGARVKGKSSKYGSLEDVDGDGDMDLIVQIENVITWAPNATEAILTGYTFDGIYIEGTDSVNIVPAGEN